MRYTALAIAAAVLVLAAGCSSTSVAKDFNDLTTPGGKPVAHINTTNISLCLLMDETRSLVGDASLNKTVSDCTREAKAKGASKVAIVQSHTAKYWYIALPISLIVTPVVSNVACNALQ